MIGKKIFLPRMELSVIINVKYLCKRIEVRNKVANNAEIMEKHIILATLRKVLVALDEDCKTVDEIRGYIRALIDEVEQRAK